MPASTHDARGDRFSPNCRIKRKRGALQLPFTKPLLWPFTLWAGMVPAAYLEIIPQAGFRRQVGVEAVLKKLEATISRERLGRYLFATKGDLYAAVELYHINIKVSQVLYGVLHGYEITFRNSMHDHLKNHYGTESWYDTAPLDGTHRDMVDKAKGQSGSGHLSAGKIIAELPLGFWTGLVAARYEQLLWLPCLRKAFPNSRMSRGKLYPVLCDIKALRNRVAHHERILGRSGRLYAGLHPIHRTELLLEPELVLECIGWICKDTAQWVRVATQFETCLTLLESPPACDLRI
jgi:hypothetical protein